MQTQLVLIFPQRRVIELGIAAGDVVGRLRPSPGAAFGEEVLQVGCCEWLDLFSWMRAGWGGEGGGGVRGGRWGGVAEAEGAFGFGGFGAFGGILAYAL